MMIGLNDNSIYPTTMNYSYISFIDITHQTPQKQHNSR